MNARRLTITLLVSAVALLSTTAWSQVYFDDSDADTIKAGNAYYEVKLLKSDGNLVGIVDRSTGEQVSSGAQYLWGLSGAETYTASTDYWGEGDSVAYSWDDVDGTLRFVYEPDTTSASWISAQASFILSSDPWFDLVLSFRNRTGGTLTTLDVPVNLKMVADDIEEAFLAFRPGVRLKREYFQERRDGFLGDYPGAYTFADFVHFGLDSGQLCFYTIPTEDLVRAGRRLSPIESEDEPDEYSWSHFYALGVRDGESFSSPRVRLRIGQDVQSTIVGFRQDSGLADFPSLQEKLGELYEGVTHGLYTRFDMSHSNNWGLHLSDAEGYGRLIDMLAPGSVLFTIAVEADSHAPDWYPFDLPHGTSDQLKLRVQDARDAGHYIVPYTNWTIWRTNSPTAARYDPSEFSILSEDGTPALEDYGDGNISYAVSPWAPAVIERVQQMVSDTRYYQPFDVLFTDQIGGRTGLDYNPSSPSLMDHALGWLELAREHKDANLFCEFGHDRLVETMVGFSGSFIVEELRIPHTFGVNPDEPLSPDAPGTGAWGEGTWEYYPVVPMMAHDKVLCGWNGLYARHKRILSYDIAMGEMINAGLDKDLPEEEDRAWRNTAAAFQRYAVGEYAGERMVDYTSEGPDATRSHFETYEILTNWSRDQTLDAGDHTLTAEGVLVTRDVGDLTAGVFTRYNGQDLSEGDHYILETRYADSLVVRHPQGEDTVIRLDLGPLADSETLHAYFLDGVRVFAAQLVTDGAFADLQLTRQPEETSEARYLITPHIIESATLAAPVTELPDNRASFASSALVTLDWRDTYGASTYIVELAEDASFANLSNSIDVSESYVNAPALETGRTYFWRVKAANAASESAWGDVRRFRIDGPSVTDRLVAHYPLDGTAQDAVGHADGTLADGVSAATDLWHNPTGALSFDGTGAGITVPATDEMDIDLGVTVSAWVYPRSFSKEAGIAVREGAWGLYVDEDGSVIGEVYSENGQRGRHVSAFPADVIQTIPLNTWTHIALQYFEGITIRVHINGDERWESILNAQGVGSPDQSNQITIGYGPGSDQTGFDGLIDDVRIYDRTLSGEEIRTLSGYPDIVGKWELTGIGDDTFTGSNSTWSFKADGTYEWFLAIPPLYDHQGTGTYTVRRDTIQVQGVIADLGTPFVVFTLGDSTFSFLDDEADRWTYRRRADQSEPPVVIEPTPDFNGDGSVNFTDFIAFAQKYGAKDGDADYDARYDLDGSRDIGFPDFIRFAQAYGKPLSGGSSGTDGFDLVGTWVVTAIGADTVTDGAAMSTWTFRSDGTYDWFLTPFEWSGGGTYSLNGRVLTTTGIMAQTIGGGSTTSLTLGDDGNSFSFADPDGDVWVYQKQN